VVCGCQLALLHSVLHRLKRVRCGTTQQLLRLKFIKVVFGWLLPHQLPHQSLILLLLVALAEALPLMVVVLLAVAVAVQVAFLRVLLRQQQTV
jgi:hypothetical protein